MALIEWDDKLSVGYLEIDEDHKHLIGIVNKLDEAIKGDQGQGTIEDIFEELLSYTVWHFRHEERLMQTYGDPTFFEHKQEHDNLTEAALAKQKAFQEGDANVVNELMPFLTAWLTEHILGTDTKTGHFLAENAD